MERISLHVKALMVKGGLFVDNRKRRKGIQKTISVKGMVPYDIVFIPLQSGGLVKNFDRHCEFPEVMEIAGDLHGTLFLLCEAGII